MSDGYRIVPFEDREDIGPADVVAFWEREDVLTAEERRRRAEETLLVAVAPDGELVGVATAFLEHDPQLLLQVWQMRTFVAAAHRGSQTVVGLAAVARRFLEERYRRGEGPRGCGLVFDVQNEQLKQRVAPIWRREGYPEDDYWFIGRTGTGSHVRVNLFAGVTAPPPPPR